MELRPLRILFAMLPEAGHHTGTFLLARRLAERGHQVSYLGLEDLRGLCERQGRRFVALAPQIMPEGYLAQWTRHHAAIAAGSLDANVRAAEEVLFRRFLRYVGGQELDELLREEAPDVVLADTFVWYVGLRALRLGLPVINLAVVLSLFPNGQVPPILDGDVPDPRWGPLGALRVRGAWARMRLRALYEKDLLGRMRGTYRHPHRMHHLTGVFRALARSAGQEPVENRTYRLGEMGPRLMLDELALCPRAFQLPGCPEDRRRYLGEVVDLERAEPAIEPELAVEARPLVYCSLGTAASHYPASGAFFERVVEAAGARPELRFVLHTGDHPSGPALSRRERDNLTVRSWVPQLALLRRAAVMVTHGGINSVMECVRFEVPMVLVPGARDQPGNAARARYHGLGRVLGMEGLQARALLEAIDEARTGDAQRVSLARMRRRIAEEPGLDGAIELIERRGSEHRARAGADGHEGRRSPGAPGTG